MGVQAQAAMSHAHPRRRSRGRRALEGRRVQRNVQAAGAPGGHEALQVPAVQVRVVQQEEACDAARRRLGGAHAAGGPGALARLYGRKRGATGAQWYEPGRD